MDATATSQTNKVNVTKLTSTQSVESVLPAGKDVSTKIAQITPEPNSANTYRLKLDINNTSVQVSVKLNGDLPEKGSTVNIQRSESGNIQIQLSTKAASQSLTTSNANATASNNSLNQTNTANTSPPVFSQGSNSSIILKAPVVINTNDSNLTNIERVLPKGETVSAKVIIQNGTISSTNNSFTSLASGSNATSTAQIQTANPTLPTSANSTSNATNNQTTTSTTVTSQQSANITPQNTSPSNIAQNTIPQSNIANSQSSNSQVNSTINTTINTNNASQPSIQTAASQKPLTPATQGQASPFTTSNINSTTPPQATVIAQPTVNSSANPNQQPSFITKPINNQPTPASTPASSPTAPVQANTPNNQIAPSNINQHSATSTNTSNTQPTQNPSTSAISNAVINASTPNSSLTTNQTNLTNINSTAIIEPKPASQNQTNVQSATPNQQGILSKPIAQVQNQIANQTGPKSSGVISQPSSNSTASPSNINLPTAPTANNNLVLNNTPPNTVNSQQTLNASIPAPSNAVSASTTLVNNQPVQNPAPQNAQLQGLNQQTSSIKIEVAGQTISLKAPANLPTIQNIQITRSEGVQANIQWHQAATVATNPAHSFQLTDKQVQLVESNLRQALPQQIPIAEGINQLVTQTSQISSHSPTAVSIDKVALSIMQLFGVKPGAPNSSETIKRNIQNGGLFTESKMANSPNTQQGDMKSFLAQLSKLADSLPTEQREQIQNTADRMLARVTSNQLTHVQQQHTKADISNERTFQMDLPVQSNEKLDNVEMEIKQRKHTNEQGQQTSIWSVKLHFDLEENGEVDAEVALNPEDNSISTTFLCSHPDTVLQLENRMNNFRQQLHQQGFEVQTLHCSQGSQVAAANNTINKRIIDIRT